MPLACALQVVTNLANTKLAQMCLHTCFAHQGFVSMHVWHGLCLPYGLQIEDLYASSYKSFTCPYKSMI